MTLPEKLTFRVSSGTMKFLRDIARDQGKHVSEIARYMLKMSMHQLATDEYYLIDVVDDLLEKNKKEHERLILVRKELMSGEEGG